MAAVPSTTFKGTTEPFDLQVARGLIPFHRIVLRGGLNPDVDVGIESLWDQGGLYVFPSSASTMTVSSSSAADTSAGTGARTVLLSGLDATHTEISEVLSLNGQTPVTTVNSYLFIHNLTVLTAGSGEEAAGDIYVGTGAVTLGVPANIFGKIRIGWGTTQMIQYTIPAGWTAHLLDITASAIASSVNQSTILTIRARPLGGVFVRGGSIVVSGGLIYIPAAVPRVFVEKTTVDAIAITTDNNVIATGLFRFLLIKNSDA